MCVKCPPQLSECTKCTFLQPDSDSHPNLRQSTLPQHTQKSARTKSHFNLSFYESPTIQKEHAESVPSNSNSRHFQPDMEEWRSSVSPATENPCPSPEPLMPSNSLQKFICTFEFFAHQTCSVSSHIVSQLK
ncbi:hypothetical protein O181_016771 [Austropuccinia psidii MF-1]|uniref:Uncharacterized protein n=1 Tax=Austropuccinia psidii MF-1 TaxID=1389203 RepID=A0A9Q3GRD2_9BASI|nr:hypothetical protein [Austropuccinia psidii MF-1]